MAVARCFLGGRLGALIIVWIAAWSGLVTGGSYAAEADEVVIGIVRDGDWQLLDRLSAEIQQEVDVLTEGELTVRYPAPMDGGWDVGRISAGLDALLADPEVDLVLAMGLAASQIASSRPQGFPKPVIAPMTIDFEIQNLPRSGAGSGVRNLTYVALPNTLRQELQTFREVVPFRHVALLANNEVLDTMPEIVPRTLAQLQGLKVEVSYVRVGRTAESALAGLPESADAVYVWPLLLDAGELRRLIAGFEERRLPSFSVLGREEVEAGMLATLSVDAGLPRLARRVALNVQRILLGEAPESIPVDFPNRERLILNVETARRIGVSPRWEVWIEAETIGDRDADGQPLDLTSAVLAAVEANLDLAAQQLLVQGGEEDVRRARSALLPQVSVSAQGTVIDRDRAESSFGAQPERQLAAGIALQQLLLSDGTRANLQIQRLLQASRQHGFDQLRLDIAFETAVAYFNLLRARNLRAVQRANLELTRANQELAQVRRSIGTASAGETYRWDSQIANDRQRLVFAESDVRAAEIALTRLLHSDQTTHYSPAAVELADPTLAPGQGRVRGYIETPKHFTLLMDFTVREGLLAAPELKALDEGIEAQRRTLTTARRAFSWPTIAADVRLDEILGRGGAGSEVDLPTDDTTWSVGVSASLPIYTGEGRQADLAQAEIDLNRLLTERAATAERIEESIRAAMVAARASFTAIDLSAAAAAAARRNLQLVQDAYGRGALSILDLLDAQNASLSADLTAANAVYDFFIDLMRVQRFSGQLDFFTSEAARNEWFGKLESFFAQQGVEPWREAG